MGRPVQWTGIKIQGRGSSDQWVTSYRVAYLNGSNWDSIDGGKVYPGNSDNSNIVTNMFEQSIVSTSIRICPQTWHKHVSMRADALFCELEQ